MQPTAPQPHAPHRPRALARIRTLGLAALLAVAPAALAQDAPSRIEDRMSAAEFMAAGLHQLSPEQLASLNAWLDRENEGQARQAAQPRAQRAEPEDDGGGLLDLDRDEPVVAHIAGGFSGFRRGRRYVLDNGQVWEQVDGAELPGVNLDNPRVEINPGLLGNIWYLKVEGYNTRAKVRRVE